MNCKQSEKYLDDYIDDALPADLTESYASHLQECSHCQTNYHSALQLKDALTTFTIPEPDKNFESRMLAALPQEKTHTAPHWLSSLVGGAVAASILMWFIFIPGMQNNDTGLELITITVPYQQRKDVQLVFNAPVDVAVAHFTITLPDNMEFYGRPGIHQLSWQTKINSGSNRLTLPLIAKGNVTGVLTAKLTSGESTKTFTIKLKSAPDSSTQLTIPQTDKTV